MIPAAVQGAYDASCWGVSYSASPSSASRARRMTDATKQLVQWGEIMTSGAHGQTRALIERHAGGLWARVERDAEGHDDEATRTVLRRAGEAWRTIQAARGQLSLF